MANFLSQRLRFKKSSRYSCKAFFILFKREFSNFKDIKLGKKVKKLFKEILKFENARLKRVKNATQL